MSYANIVQYYCDFFICSLLLLLIIWYNNNRFKRKGMSMEKSKLKQKYKIVETLFDNMGKDHVSEYSAQCAYYTILSFIPFIILLITLIQYTGMEPKTLFDVISKIIPETNSISYFSYIFKFLFKRLTLNQYDILGNRKEL